MTKLFPFLLASASLAMAASTGHASGCVDSAGHKATVVEMVTFKLAQGVTDADFLQATDAMETNFLCGYKGFIRRTLSKSDDGTWLDHIEWADMKAATQALEAAMLVPEAEPFFQAIDPESISLKHLMISRQTK